jgi:hypothetical protein
MEDLSFAERLSKIRKADEFDSKLLPDIAFPLTEFLLLRGISVVIL